MNSTTSWINIVLSIEMIFRNLLPNIPIYRFALPGDVAKQRALIASKALFFSLVQGEIDRFQDTYCTLWLCEAHSPQKQYLPEGNLQAIWLQEQATILQQALDTGDENSNHFFPLYDYQSLIPFSVYQTFLQDGDTTNISSWLQLQPQQIRSTGFVVRAGHAKPAMVSDKNPAILEWTVVFQHWSPDVYSGMRG
jgi:hypothetical protein